MFTSPVNVSYFRLSFLKCMESVDVRVGLEGWGGHPYERVAQTRQGESDRWEETRRKGRTGRGDFYRQAARSEVTRALGRKPSTTSVETSSDQISTFPFCFFKATSSIFPPPRDNYHLQRFPSNEAIIPVSVK